MVVADGALVIHATNVTDAVAVASAAPAAAGAGVAIVDVERDTRAVIETSGLGGIVAAVLDILASATGTLSATATGSPGGATANDTQVLTSTGPVPVRLDPRGRAAPRRHRGRSRRRWGHHSHLEQPDRPGDGWRLRRRHLRLLRHPGPGRRGGHRPLRRGHPRLPGRGARPVGPVRGRHRGRTLVAPLARRVRHRAGGGDRRAVGRTRPTRHLERSRTRCPARRLRDGRGLRGDVAERLDLRHRWGGTVSRSTRGRPHHRGRHRRRGGPGRSRLRAAHGPLEPTCPPLRRVPLALTASR